MQSKRYKLEKKYVRAYKKKVGNAWEIGLTSEGKVLFVGHLHASKDASTFWKSLNQQIKLFGKRFSFPQRTSSSWATKFLANHAYSHYYQFMGRLVPSQHRTYQRLRNQDIKKLRKLRKDRPTAKKQLVHLKAA